VDCAITPKNKKGGFRKGKELIADRFYEKGGGWGGLSAFGGWRKVPQKKKERATSLARKVAQRGRRLRAVL